MSRYVDIEGKAKNTQNQDSILGLTFSFILCWTESIIHIYHNFLYPAKVLFREVAMSIVTCK